MIDPSNHALAVELIQGANRNGARLSKACQILPIHEHTYQRWVVEGGVKVDQRPRAKRCAPRNKLSVEEKSRVLEITKQDEYLDLPPTLIVPHLAHQLKYIASESTFYRILHEE